MTREQAAQLLADRGVLPTAQRVELALFLLDRPQHLSAEQILSAIRARGLRISKATVYNTLNLFCERGLLRTVDVDPTRQFYDSCTSPHHHFYNVDSGELTDIPSESVSLAVTTALPPGTERAGVDVIVRVRSSAPGQ
jgi:Fur family iron response transcriptional regulator